MTYACLKAILASCLASCRHVFADCYADCYADCCIAVDPRARTANCLIHDPDGTRRPMTFYSWEAAERHLAGYRGRAWREFHEIIRYDEAQREWQAAAQREADDLDRRGLQRPAQRRGRG